MLEEAADRYGPLPTSVLNLADYGRIRVMADRLGIETIDREGRVVVLKFRPQARLDPVRLVALVRQRARPDARPACGAQAEARREPAAEPQVGQPAPRQVRKGPLGVPQAAPSWWTARAREAEVKPGFTKEEILKPRQGRSAGARRRVRAGRRLVERAARSRIKYLTSRL